MIKIICPECKSTNINEWYFDNTLHKCRICHNYFEDKEKDIIDKLLNNSYIENKWNE